MKRAITLLFLMASPLMAEESRQYIPNILDPAYQDMTAQVLNENFEKLFSDFQIDDDKRFYIADIEDPAQEAYNAIAINGNFESLQMVSGQENTEFKYTVESILDTTKADKNTFYINSGFDYFWNILDQQGGTSGDE